MGINKYVCTSCWFWFRQEMYDCSLDAPSCEGCCHNCLLSPIKHKHAQTNAHTLNQKQYQRQLKAVAKDQSTTDS